MALEKGLSFDDVLLVPQYSEVRSRSLVNLDVRFGCFNFSHPIISANMDTVTGHDMACAMKDSGSIGILHRNIPLTERILPNLPGFAFGVNEDLDLVLDRVHETGANFLVLDIAHGDSKHALDAVEYVRNRITLDEFVLVGGTALSEQHSL